MKSAPPQHADDLMAALQSRQPGALGRYFASLFPGADFTDEPEPLALLDSEWISGAKVPIPAAIARYLASGDVLTDHTIDMMECAMETAYNVTTPWFITSLRIGSAAAGNLSVDYFYLLNEREPLRKGDA